MFDSLVLSRNVFPDYELLDSGNEERLERFDSFVIRRPDPQCLWKPQLSESEWNRCHAAFIKRGDGDRGEWKYYSSFSRRWTMRWNDIAFFVEPTPFKHLGVFPEQAVHWQWMYELISSRRAASKTTKVLNLFGYTGIASVVCACAGASVTHVDASKPSINWARDNMQSTGLPETAIRWILEDVPSFVRREVRRGNRYDAIILDPPVIGHGAKGELWKFNEHFPELMQVCSQMFSDDFAFVLVNAYAVSASSVMLHNVLSDYAQLVSKQVTSGELLIEERGGRMLSTGIYGRLY